MTLDSRKLNLLEKILSINNQSVLRLIDQAVHEIESKHFDSLDDIRFYIGHIEPKVSVEKIAKDQNVKPLLMDEFDTLVDEANFTDDIDELLALLK